MFFTILFQSQVFDSNSSYKVNDNKYFNAKKKTRCIDLLTKVIVFYIRKIADYYCQNNKQDNKSLLFKLNQ